MPRQTRRLPLDIDRFNYWDKEICRPTDRAILELRSQFASASDVGEMVLAERFERHLQGPCGEPLCRVDRRLERQPRERRELALRDYVENTREWDRNPRAHQILRGLRPAERKALVKFAKKTHGVVGRRSWATLVSTIRRDLRWFEKMLPLGPARVVDSDEYPAMRRVWTVYARQALALLNLGPTSLEISLGVVERAAAGRQRARIDLSGISPEQRGLILHWFHHAFRNLIRYWNGHPQLPFDRLDTRCAAGCRDAVIWGGRPSLPQARGHGSGPASRAPAQPPKPAV